MTQRAERTTVDTNGHYTSTIDGQAVTSAETAPAHNRATREVIGEVPVTTRAQLYETILESPERTVITRYTPIGWSGPSCRGTFRFC